MGIRQGLWEARACAMLGPWTAPCPRGAGWDTSCLLVILNKASESAVPGSALRSQNCGGEKGSVASSAASQPFPSSRPACVWASAGQAGLNMVDGLRYCWIAVSDSYACVKKQK